MQYGNYSFGHQLSLREDQQTLKWFDFCGTETIHLLCIFGCFFFCLNKKQHIKIVFRHSQVLFHNLSFSRFLGPHKPLVKVGKPVKTLTFSLLSADHFRAVVLMFGWLCWCYMALRHILGHFRRSQLTQPHCSWASLLGSLPVLSAHSFASN